MVVSKKFYALFLITLLNFATIQYIDANTLHRNGLIISKTYELPKERNIYINVVFVNYNSSLVDQDMLYGLVYKRVEEYLATRSIWYNFKLNIHFANSSFWANLKSLVDSIKVFCNTSDLSESKLMLQKNLVLSGHLSVRIKVFYNNVSGYSIDASKVEEWLANHSDGLDKGYYYIYFLNLSYLDDHSKGIEHWFSVKEYDVDSNVSRTFWRLEWEYGLNENVSFPYPAYSHKTRIIFVDPTAYNWYLNWTRIWWGGIPDTDEFGRYYLDLDHFIEYYEGDDLGKSVTHYLAGWLNDLIDDLFGYVMSSSLAGGSPYEKKISVQVKVVNQAEKFIDLNSLKWVVHGEFVKRAFLDLYPRWSISIDIKFYNLSQLEEIQQILNDSIIQDYSNKTWTYYDGPKIYSSLYSLRSKYFNLTVAGKVLTAWIFILYNGSMVVNGREFTGLGGMGNVVILMSIHRVLGWHLNRPKRGFTRVIVHELGHAIGAYHTFEDSSYASDFIYDVMGYYPYAWNFSKIRKDMMLRYIADYRLDRLEWNFKELLTKINWNNVSEYVKEIANDINQKLLEADRLVNKTKFLEANYVLDEVENDLQMLKKISQDSEPPYIEIIYPKSGSLLKNGTVYLLLNVSDNVGLWKIEVFLNNEKVFEGLSNKILLNLSKGKNIVVIKAYDHAGNAAEKKLVLYFGERPSEIPPTIILIIALIILFVLLNVILAKIRKKS